jgi:hypothetical protein
VAEDLLPFPLYGLRFFCKLACGHVIYRGAAWYLFVRCPVCAEPGFTRQWLPVRKEDVAW